MASRSDISAGKAFVELYVKRNAFVTGLQDASRRLRDIGKSMALLGAASAASSAAILTPLAALTGSFARSSSELRKLALQTGATVEELTAMQFAAERMNIEPDDLIGAIEELNIRLGETVRDGVGPAAEAFKQLGLDGEQLANMPLPERLATIAQALSQIQNQATRGFLADEIFGGDAFKILPLLRQGADGIRALATEAERLGSVRTGDQVAGGAKLYEVWTDLATVAKSMADAVGGALAPAMEEIGRMITGVASGASKWIKENAGLVRTIAAIGIGLGVAGGALITFGITLSGIGFALGGIASGITTVGSLVAAMVSPFGLVVGAITGGVLAWANFTESGQASIRSIAAMFGSLYKIASDTVTGIGNALMAGNLELAGEIAMEGLRLTVIAGMQAVANSLGGVWGETVAFIGNALLSGDFQGAWQAGLSAMFAGWKSLASGLVNTMAAAAKGVVSVWQKAVTEITVLLLHMEKAEQFKLKAMGAPPEMTPLLDKTDEEIRATATSVVGNMASGVTAGIDAIALEFGEAAELAAAMLDATVGGATVDMEDAMEASAMRLSALSDMARQQAAAHRARLDGMAAAVMPEFSMRSLSAGPGASGGFSVAGLMASAGSPQQQMARDIRDMREAMAALRAAAPRFIQLVRDRLVPAVFRP